MKKTCNHCRFAEPALTTDGQKFMWCHRVPPIIVRDNSQISTTMPPVGAQTWCGEWKLAWNRLFRGHVQS